MKRLITLVLLLSLCAGLCACAGTANATTATLLTPKNAHSAPQNVTLTPDFYAQQNILAWKLFSAALAQSQGENVLISPLSVQLALTMTANGANGKTLEEMQALFCADSSLADMNGRLSAYLSGLPSEEKAKLHIANSIWYRGGEHPIAVKPDFLETCAAYYGAQAYKAPFDSQTVADINRWVSENTDGMIPKLVEQLGPEAAMVLVNALCFDAKWQSVYTADDVQEGTFTSLDGQAQQAQYMQGSEYRFLELENATGFVKSYAAGGYQFAALLPNKGVDIGEFATKLSPEQVQSALANPQQILVQTWLPKFTCEYSLNMNQLLCQLGMPTAFDENAADFSKMSDTALCISEVIHKTKISVDEQGTQAAAATAVIMRECSAMIPTEYKTVRLDRPFVYMILDENNVPLFIGVVTTLE